METEVTPQGAQPSGAGDKPQGGSGKGGDEKVSLSRAEFEALRRDRDEARESERFWAARARSGDQPQHAEEPEEMVETADLIPDVTGDQSVDEAIFNDPDRWAEAISKGPAAIKAFIKSQGLITGSEAAEIAAKVARRTVDVERGKMSSDAAIMRDFPGLADPKSEFFKATSAELKKFVALDPRAKNSPATLYAAAETAKAKLEAKQAADRRRGRDDEDDDHYDRFERDDEREADRRARADAQDGTRIRNRGTEDDYENTLGPEARETMRQMGVTEEEYKASVKELRGSRPSRGRRA